MNSDFGKFNSAVVEGFVEYNFGKGKSVASDNDYVICDQRIDNCASFPQ